MWFITAIASRMHVHTTSIILQGDYSDKCPKTLRFHLHEDDSIHKGHGTAAPPALHAKGKGAFAGQLCWADHSVVTALPDCKQECYRWLLLHRE